MGTIVFAMVKEKINFCGFLYILAFFIKFQKTLPPGAGFNKVFLGLLLILE